MNSLFLSTNAPCSSTSGSNLFLVLPSFLYSGKFIRPPISQRNKIIRVAPSYDYQLHCPILRSVVSAFFEGDYCLCSPASSPSCLIRYRRSFSFKPLLSQWKKVVPPPLLPVIDIGTYDGWEITIVHLAL